MRIGLEEHRVRITTSRWSGRISALIVWWLVAGSVGFGCAPIAADTEQRERLIQEETRQEFLDSELGIQTRLLGDDPRSNAQLEVEVTEYRRCEDKTYQTYERNEITRREISGWTYPLMWGLLGLSTGVCAGIMASGAECASSEDDQEPTTPQEHRTTMVTMGVTSVLSFAMIGVDLWRARDTVEELEPRTDIVGVQQVDCGSAPAADIRVMYGFERDDMPVEVSTDSRGIAQIPVHRQDWIDQNQDGAGVVRVNHNITESLGDAPQSWRQVRDEVNFEQELRQVRDDGSLESGVELFDDYRGTEFADQALDHLLTVGQQEVSRGEYRRVARAIDDVRKNGVADEHEQRLQEFSVDVDLQLAQAALGDELSMDVDEVLAAVRQAMSTVETQTRREELRVDGFEYGIAALETEAERTDDEAAPEWTSGVIEELIELADSDDQMERVDEAQTALNRQIIEGKLNRAQQLQSDGERDYAVRQAYIEVLDDLDEVDEEYRDEVFEEVREAVLERLETHVDDGNRQDADREFRQLGRQLDDPSMLRIAYRDLVFEYYRQAQINQDTQQIRDHYENWALSLIEDESDDIEFRRLLLATTVDVLEQEVEQRPESLLSEYRGLFDEIEDGIDDPEVPEELRTEFDEQRRRTQQTFRRHLRPHQISSRDDLLWLYPAHLSSSGELESLSNSPSSHIDQRVFATVRIDESLGGGTFLAEETSTSSPVVVSASGLSEGARVDVLANVVGTVADGRTDDRRDVPELSVLWSQ